MTKHKYVLVEWLDACSWSDWRSEKDALLKQNPLIQTVGMLLEMSDRRVCVALNYEAGDDEVSDVVMIPRAMVERVVELREGNYLYASKEDTKEQEKERSVKK